MRRSVGTTLALVALALLVAGGAWAQGAVTSRISGQVIGTDGAGLPGVTVTFESPNLQGSRVVATEAGGNYTSPPLPPGVYTVTFELAGYQPQAQQVRASADARVSANATLEQVDIREEITVTGEAIETVSQTSVSSSTITNETLEELPIGRTITDAVNLSAGVTQGVNGPSLSGGMSWDNLYTLNGVVMNENIRGQPFNNLYIEDSVQETSTTVGGVSAEYGRFTGGVVTAITKSGGNEFSGSLRAILENDDWQGSNEFSPDRIDEVRDTYEATLGGRILRDRLWFFTAGRTFEDPGQALATNVLALPYTRGAEEDRLEGKLTVSLTQSHQVQGSYIEIDNVQTNVPHGGLSQFVVTVDDGSLDPQRDLPQTLQVFSYTGILTDNFFLEGHYGEREFAFEGTGGSFNGNFGESSPIFDNTVGTMSNESWFCGTCRPEDRNNEQGQVKGTYFRSTETMGAHDFIFGYQTFTDIRASDNHQSPTDWTLETYAGQHRQGNLLTPIVASDPNPGLTPTTLWYYPILSATRGTDFQTDSIFVNDSWRLDDAWSFNLGLRWDSTDATNAEGNKVAKDDAISPRLSASWNPRGMSPWTYHLSAGRYVGAAVNGVFDSSSAAGRPASFAFGYSGPSFNLDPATAVDAPTAIERAFDWLVGACPEILSVWDPANPTASPPSIDPLFGCDQLFFASIPGSTTVLADNLSPTSMDEAKLGFSRAIGNVGLVRADIVRRKWDNFFVTQRDLTTINPGDSFDAGLLLNSEVMTREYTALDVSGNFSMLDRRLRLGGSLTLSELEGNGAGETTGSGAVSTGLLVYPEYRDLSWNAPEGKLQHDQPVRARLWAAYDVFQAGHHRVTLSGIQRFDSGTPYGASESVDVGSFVTNPGYRTPPSTNTFWFTNRDAFRTEDITRTDLGINYSLSFGRWELFVQPEVLNVFDEDAVTNAAGTLNTQVCTVRTQTSSACAGAPPLQSFNPFTETPVEGVHWTKGANFGKPLSDAQLQDVREYRISIGFKFNP